MPVDSSADIHLSAELLSGLDIFSGVDLDAIADLLGAIVQRRLGEGDVLLQAGRNNACVYLLVRGRLGVLADGESKDDIVAELEVGELIGEISVLDRRPCSATVIALHESVVLEVSEPLLWALVRNSPELSRNLLILLAERLRSIREQFGRRIELSKASERSASIDPLTGLYNRRWLDHALPLMLAECSSTHEPLSLMMMDLDHFKQYNDTHGHPAGDRVLQKVARSITTALRDADRAARYGGEEFCVILPAVGGPGALSIAERVCEAVRTSSITKRNGDALPPVTISIGLADMAPDDTAHTLIEKADRALYCAKHCGRDRVCGWSEALG